MNTYQIINFYLRDNFNKPEHNDILYNFFTNILKFNWVAWDSNPELFG